MWSNRFTVSPCSAIGHSKVSRDTALSLVDWKPVNDRAVIVAIYSMALDQVNENVPGIAIGKANVSHQKKILDNRKQNSEHSETRLDSLSDRR